MLKVTINSTEFEALSDEMKAEYKIQPDLSYALDLGPNVFTTDKDPAGLMSALENERKEHAATKKVADKLEADKLEADRSKITDAEELRASFKQEVDKIRKDHADERKREAAERKEALTKVAEGQRRTKALELASKLFGTNATIMLPHVEARLGIIDGDVPIVGILDPTTGQQSLDQNFENLEKNLSTNPSFAPMVVVSKASGGSANDGKSSGLPNGKTDEGKPKTYSDYTPTELMAIKQSEPEQFQKLKSERT